MDEGGRGAGGREPARYSRAIEQLRHRPMLMPRVRWQGCSTELHGGRSMERGARSLRWTMRPCAPR